MPARPAPSKSLSLRWVAVAIVVFVALYSFLRIHYGKPGKAFEPYRDLGERATTRRLVDLGYQRLTVDLERPADPLPSARVATEPAEIRGALGGLPAELAGALALKPALPATISGVTAPREISPAAGYALQFSCAQGDYRTQIESVLLLRKDRELFLLPNFEPVPGHLLARWKDTLVLARFSTAGLPPGRYAVTLCGQQASKHWEFTVR